MLARYLGNKTSVLEPLIDTIGIQAQPGAHVVDAFSGSLAVSLGLKRHGYRVTANDINLFSSVFADAYLIPDDLPPVVADGLVPVDRATEFRIEARAQADSLCGAKGFSFLDDPARRSRYVEFLSVLRYLETMDSTDVPEAFAGTNFFDTYCEQGANSAFTSSRGTIGRRRFFTPENATRIDLVLNQLRAWKQRDTIDPHTYALVLAAIVRAVERISNTQGTFHDFLRDRWDSRALKDFALSPIALDDMIGGVAGHRAGREQDTLEFIETVDDHAVLYLDPPYNFRQYTAYYFLPNVICRFPEMEDPSDYFSNVKFVRGQNPRDDFTSTFCKASHFINDMRRVIQKARCDSVVISYYNGANHWGSFDSGPSNIGQDHLTQLLGEDLFVPGSQRVVEVKRRNYASYGGYKAREVNELLLVAKKRQDVDHAPFRSTDRRLQPVA